MKKFDLFLEKYNKDYISHLKMNEDLKKKFYKFFKFTLMVKKNKKKIIIFGNGGSASIASHFSVDMTKNGNVRCVNFNESNLLTCFSNDYGYENWVKEALKFYCDTQDLIILISSSGKSLNMINAAKFLKNKNNKLITFTGFGKKNKLSKLGDLNFVVNSKSYNLIENIHQYWLLILVDIFSKNKIK
ncbi:SIS domain-containing protein [Candidatus Pelagibacter bacterium nBUS_44]|uniref:SIS domain-containing protein n=1 Tax=Candidatus Pelagibacter bacterium nBUS_44 TaxID=3374195 RepID=UPI003EC056BE